ELMVRADIADGSDGIIIPEYAIIPVTEKEWDGHFRIVLEEGYLLSFVIEEAILVLSEAVEGVCFTAFKSLCDAPASLTFENDGLEPAAADPFFCEDLFAIGVEEGNGTGL